MAELPISNVPVTLVVGFLGVGKTTALLDLFQHRPGDGRWAVLVNEFGEVGIDGAVLTDGGLEVSEVAGGCICCSAGMALKGALVELIRKVQPTRLLIEPTGLAHPASVIDTLRTPGLREALSLRAVITLVDPRHVRSERHQSSHTWNDQVQIADVLVANKTDLASAEDLAAFHELANAAWPPKQCIAETTHGRLDPAWLDLAPPATERATTPDHVHTEAQAQGWIWPPHAAFDRDRLERALQMLVRPGGVLPNGVMRLKGVFRTRRGWLLVHADQDTITWHPLGHRRDSRVEIIAPLGPIPWDDVRAALDETRLR